MTLWELYKKAVNDLSFGGCGEFEAKIIFEDILKIQTKFYDYSTVLATEELERTLESVIERRKDGEPLQYIVGKWDFYGFTFSVGEGVLIPRPETEILVENVLNDIKEVNNPVVFDLCSGTGCIGLTIAKLRPDAQVYLLEKEEKAFSYLLDNVKYMKTANVEPLKCDIFNFDYSSLPQADLIVSNPPYIKTDEVFSLQEEVMREPMTALDGGKDGLMFYKCIALNWAKKLKKGGLIEMECADGQSEEIISLFKDISTEKKVLFDFNNIDRIVVFRI